MTEAYPAGVTDAHPYFNPVEVDDDEPPTECINCDGDEAPDIRAHNDGWQCDWCGVTWRTRAEPMTAQDEHDEGRLRQWEADHEEGRA